MADATELFFEALRAKIGAEVGRGVMTLGEMIVRLEAAPQDAHIRVPFYDAYAGCLDSYRGYYEMLAIDHQAAPKTVADFLKEAREAVGSTFIGYKGGDFTMDRNTPIWVAEYGASTGQAVMAIETKDSVVEIISAERD